MFEECFAGYRDINFVCQAELGSWKIEKNILIMENKTFF